LADSGQKTESSVWLMDLQTHPEGLLTLRILWKENKIVWGGPILTLAAAAFLLIH
jgi:hypothetical protein